MLLNCHLTPSVVNRIQEKSATDSTFADIKDRFLKRISNDGLYKKLTPGQQTWNKVSAFGIGHDFSALSVFYMIHPTPQLAEILRNFLLWIPEQESLMWIQGGLSIGQFLKGAILALDAYGEELTLEQQQQIVKHLILCCIENPDPDNIMNNHPTGAIPFRRYLEIPGTGFHLKDEEVNNWDVIAAMGLGYVARAMSVVLPDEKERCEYYRDLVIMRLRRFLKHSFSPEGEYGEGPGYFSYGVCSCVHLMDNLDSWIGLKTIFDDEEFVGLYNSPIWSREMYHGAFENGHFNLNDSATYTHESPMHLYWLANKTGSPECQNYADAMMETINNGTQNPMLEYIIFSYVWRNNDIKSHVPSGRQFFNFGRFGTVSYRTGYSDDDIHFVIQSGDHAGAHTHAARGNMVLHAFGEYLLCDAGRPDDRTIPEYYPWHRSTVSHNCWLVNGQQQITESAPQQYLKGHIAVFNETDNGVYVLADASELYESAEQVTRCVYISHAGWLLIKDSVQPAESGFSLLLHTDNHDGQATVIRNSRAVTFQRPKAGLYISFLDDAEIVSEKKTFHESNAQGAISLQIDIARNTFIYGMLPFPGTAAPTIDIQQTDILNYDVSYNSIVEKVTFPQ